MASGFLLDTNIVSYLLDGRDTVLIEHVAAVVVWRPFVFFISIYEICVGIKGLVVEAPHRATLFGFLC